MFDRLLESGFPTNKKRRGGYFIATTLVYFAALIAIAAAAVMWFNPGLAEALELKTRLEAPSLESTLKPIKISTRSGANSNAPAERFEVPSRPPEPPGKTEIEPPDGERFGDRPIGPLVTGHGSGVPGGSHFGIDGSGGKDRLDAPPPPAQSDPPPTPKPVASKAISDTVSERVLRGRAISAITPAYPEPARRAHIAGPVQIQVTISEDGRVIESVVLNGHPLLRQAALMAARRWIFSPTLLNGLPVKVQGILTFNFILN